MTRHAAFKRPSRFVIGHIEQTNLCRTLIELVFSRQNERFVRASANTSLRRVRRFHEHRQCIRAVAQLAMRQSAERHRGRLQADINSLQLHVDDDIGSQRHRTLMRNQRVNRRVFRRRFVQVDRHVDFLGFNQLNNAVCHLLRQRAILFAGIAAVDIARFASGKGLSHIVHIDIRIGPLMDRIGRSGTMSERSDLTGRRRQMDFGRMSFLRIVVRRAAGVRPRNNIQRAFLRHGVFNEKHCRHVRGHLVGVRSAENQRRRAFLFPLHDIHFRITGRILELGEIVAEHFDFRNARTADNHVLFPHRQKSGARYHTGCDDGNGANHGDDLIFFHLHIRSLT